MGGRIWQNLAEFWQTVEVVPILTQFFMGGRRFAGEH